MAQACSTGVQTDCATPALARFGSDQLRRDFLAPALAGDHVACIGVSEPGEPALNSFFRGIPG